MLETLLTCVLRLRFVPLGSPNNFNQHFLGKLFTPRTVLIVWKPGINFSTVTCTLNVVIRDFRVFKEQPIDHKAFRWLWWSLWNGVTFSYLEEHPRGVINSYVHSEKVVRNLSLSLSKVISDTTWAFAGSQVHLCLPARVVIDDRIALDGRFWTILNTSSCTRINASDQVERSNQSLKEKARAF